jgi:hypothetical protein
MSTPMYDTEEPSLKGPYYVPWKKTTMDLYNKLKQDEDESIYADTRYKSRGGYIEGSTIGNVPLKDETDNNKTKSDSSENKNKTD